MRKKKVFSMALFLLGFGILLYPVISRTYYDMLFRDEAIEMTENLINDERSAEIYKQQVNYNESEISNPEEIEIADVGFVEESEKVDTKKVNYLTNENILGIISIPAIDLVYPIYDGATHQNLLDGVARIEGTSYPVGGINTNSVISGHNGMAGRTYFSRINKLVPGDIIEIQNRKELLTYEAYNTAVIKPTDLAALAVIPGQDTLTLLTCTSPPGTHRYLVYAKRVTNREQRAEIHTSGEESKAQNQEEQQQGEQQQGEQVQEEQEEKSQENITQEVQVKNEIRTKEDMYQVIGPVFERVDIVAKRYGVLISMIILAIIAIYYIFIREKN